MKVVHTKPNPWLRDVLQTQPGRLHVHQALSPYEFANKVAG